MKTFVERNISLTSQTRAPKTKHWESSDDPRPSNLSNHRRWWATFFSAWILYDKPSTYVVLPVRLFCIWLQSLSSRKFHVILHMYCTCKMAGNEKLQESGFVSCRSSIITTNLVTVLRVLPRLCPGCCLDLDGVARQVVLRHVGLQHTGLHADKTGGFIGVMALTLGGKGK